MKCFGYALLKVSQNTPREVKTKIYKVMNGTTVTLRGRRYRTKGLVNSINGVRLASSVYAIPVEHVPRVLEKLSEKKLEAFVQVINLCTCVCE